MAEREELVAPDRIIFIRHAEEHGVPGVVETGETDAHSLTVRGWQRAGALARRLVPEEWPQARYDLFWVLDRTRERWSFTERPQLLLAGDA